MNLAQLGRFLLEDANELGADQVPLLLGLLDALEASQEALLRLHVHEWNLEVIAKGLDHLLGLATPHEAVIDEDAGELLTDRLVDQQRRDRGVDAARESADHLLRSNLLANTCDLLVDHLGRRPGRRDPNHLVQEALENLLAVRGVHDLGVELDGIKAALRILEGGERCRGGAGDYAGAGRSSGDRVAMTHPDGLLAGQLGAEQRSLLDPHLRLAELPHPGSLDLAAQVLRHQVHAVADAEHGNAQLEQLLVDAGRVLDVDRGGPAREDDRARISRRHFLRRELIGDELGVDVRLAHAPSDQLGILAPEIEDEYGPLFARHQDPEVG